MKAARQIWGQLPVRISSLTWKPPSPWRAEEKGSGSLPTNVDPRQMSLFGAGWAVGALSRLFGASVAGITLLETTGWLGVMERPEGCSLPDLFPSLPGGVFPLYHVLADCAEFRDGSMLPVRTSRDSDIQILRLRSNRANAWVLANPTAFPQTVVLKHLSGRVMIRKLEVGNALLSMQHPGHFRKREVEVIKGLRGTLRLELPPFSCQRVSW